MTNDTLTTSILNSYQKQLPVYAANQSDLTYCRFTLRKTKRSRLTLALFRQLACHTRGFQHPCQQRCEHNIDFCCLRLRKKMFPHATFYFSTTTWLKHYSRSRGLFYEFMV